MTRQRALALPANLPPHLLGREAAAAYVGVSSGTLDLMVKAGTMPAPKIIHGRRIGWDVRALDLAIDALPADGGDALDHDTWGDDAA